MHGSAADVDRAAAVRQDLRLTAVGRAVVDPGAADGVAERRRIDPRDPADRNVAAAGVDPGEAAPGDPPRQRLRVGGGLGIGPDDRIAADGHGAAGVGADFGQAALRVEAGRSVGCGEESDVVGAYRGVPAYRHRLAGGGGQGRRIEPLQGDVAGKGQSPTAAVGSDVPRRAGIDVDLLDTNLAQNTTFFYRVFARNALGTSPASAVVSATT